MYPVFGNFPYNQSYSNMVPSFQHQPFGYSNFSPCQPIQHVTTIIVVNTNSYPQMCPSFAPNQHYYQTPMPAYPAYNYNNYYPIPHHYGPPPMPAPSAAPGFFASPFNLNPEFGMGLDFVQPPLNQPVSAVASMYCMDFLDNDEAPPASTSVTTGPMRTESIEDALQRAAFSTVNDDETQCASSPLLSSSSSLCSLSAASATFDTPPQSPSPTKEGTKALYHILLRPNVLPNLQVLGEEGRRRFKHRNFDEEILDVTKK